jgi:ankyrin repeat protein
MIKPIILITLLVLALPYQAIVQSRTSQTKAIFHAIKKNDVVQVAHLLRGRNRANLANTFDAHHRTPLLWAACLGNTKICRLLLSAGARIEARDDEGNTPLIVAAGNCEYFTYDVYQAGYRIRELVIGRRYP